jgi:ATP-binding cassette subfamily B (MDR/TAP) protein 1
MGLNRVFLQGNAITYPCPAKIVIEDTNYSGSFLFRSLGMAAPDISSFLHATAAAYPIFEMIEKNTMSKISSESGRNVDRVDGHIEFKDVCFRYPSRPDVTIFDKFCLDIPSGKIVALVGGSGSGKSTVISLIERFYDPLFGKILLDGNDIRDLDLKWLRQQIGLVNQEPALFATSIRENILYGKDDATLEEITRAAKLSGAMSFINNLPDKFETQVLIQQFTLLTIHVNCGTQETNCLLKSRTY